MIKIFVNSMMNIWHLAIAEMRSCRRLLRTWLLIAIASSLFIYQWIILSQSYIRDTLNSPIAGVLGPRYTIFQFAPLVVMCFALGIVFLAFDVRPRDVRDRIFESVDSRQVSNLDLVTGRLLGNTILLLIPAVLIIAVVLVYGLLAPLLGWQSGVIVEPVSVLSFLTWDIVPNLILWGSLTMLLTVVLRSRVAVALVVLGVMNFYYLLLAAMPLYLKTALSTFSGTALLASDLAPQFLSWDILLNRSGVLILASSFLLLATGLYPRLINRAARSRWIGAGLSVFLMGVLIIGGLGYSKISDLQRVEHWASVHKDHQSHHQTDIDSIKGIVEIRPGRLIKLDLELVMAINEEENMDSWLFSLNPGYRIERIAVDDEIINDDDYEFKDGILLIPITKRENSRGTIHLVAQGVPDPLFSYLDSALDWRTMEPTKARRLALLGQRPYVFHPQFFALLSGVSWFPTSGSAYGKHVFETHKRDYFDLDLEVHVPDKWIVAGPGTRQNLKPPHNGFRFNPRQTVPEFALIGSTFVRRGFETCGIEFELLLSPKHTKNLSALESAVPALKEWTETQIDTLRAGGLNYPLGTLSLVEVPTHLRVYGGGWNMASAYSPPGIHMLRESGFPIAQFHRVKASAEEEFGDDLEGLGSYLFEYVKLYFRNDLHGGSPMVSLGEQFLGYQTTPHGKGATALHAFVNELMANLVLDETGLFSIYLIVDGHVDLQMGADPNDYFAKYFIEMIRNGRINRSSVWTPALNTALSDLNFESRPRNALEVILLKSEAISWTVRDLVPAQKISAFLERLISEHRGRTYTPQDFFRIAQDQDIDFELLVGDWLNSTDLPGFLVQQPIVEWVQDGEQSNFEYQTSFVIRNDEAVPGAVGIQHQLLGQRLSMREGTWSDTVHVPGNTSLRVALRSSRPIARVTLYPHLALNRGRIFLRAATEGDSVARGSPLPYLEQYDWVRVEDDSIVVDDLSEGFSILNGRVHQPLRDKPPLFAYFFGPEEFDTDLNHGLPSSWSAGYFAARGEFSLWFRDTEITSYGKYYSTYVLNPMGGKVAQPRFVAKLPSPGRWLLEFHVPSFEDQWFPTPNKNPFGLDSYTHGPRDLGNHRFEVKVGDTTESMELDLSGAQSGWYELGIFETDSNEVSVTLIEVTDGVALADAVRWTPAE